MGPAGAVGDLWTAGGDGLNDGCALGGGVLINRSRGKLDGTHGGACVVLSGSNDGGHEGSGDDRETHLEGLR